MVKHFCNEVQRARGIVQFAGRSGDSGPSSAGHHGIRGRERRSVNTVASVAVRDAYWAEASPVMQGEPMRAETEISGLHHDFYSAILRSRPAQFETKRDL
jgi:hypothetical protein